MKMIGFLDSVGRDLRCTLRGLSRQPAFTLAAVLTLALGIGATTAIFSVVYSVLIKPLPYPNADRLMSIRHSTPGIRGDELAASTSMYVTYRDENRTFADIGLWQVGSATLTGIDKSERVRALLVTDGTLQALGVRPMRGRWFTKQEYGPAAEGPAPVILSYAFWRRRFGGDEAALGRELSIDSEPARVVGIMPPTFTFLDMTSQPDVILAVRLDPAKQFIGGFAYQMLARLKPGVTRLEARADLARMVPIWLRTWPLPAGLTFSRQAIAKWRITPSVRPLKDSLVGGVASMLWVLMGAIGAVLLIACANIANLTLVRTDARRREFAVRAALGAGPARIARELLIESLVIGATGSVLGLLLAYIGLHVLVANGPSDLPRLREISVYPPVLAFTVAVSLVSTLAFGSMTALKQALHVDMPAIGAARGSSASRERSTTRSALVVVQVALALVLVVSAALMIRTFQALREVDAGFSDPATIQTARIWIPKKVVGDAKQYTSVVHEILDKISALPGVTSAGLAASVPMGAQQFWGGGVVVEGQRLAQGATPPVLEWNYVSPGYFKAMGTRMIAGRSVTWRDIEQGSPVAVISENFARELAEEPAGALGKRIRLPFAQSAWREVVGVVQSVHENGLNATAPKEVYWTDNTFRPAAVTFAVRSQRAGTVGLMNEIREAVRSVNGSIPVAQIRTMQDLYAGSFARTSFTLVMLAIAGAMALALGAVGIYGVIAYVVSQSTREIGIRLALGAHPRRLEEMFLLRGLALSGFGAAIGFVATVALGRLMSSLLFGVGPLDPVAYLAALGVIVLAAALASYLPARRAASVDPMETLKAE